MDPDGVIEVHVEDADDENTGGKPQDNSTDGECIADEEGEDME